jgi:serine/threonine protein phosphatase PrpC
VKRLHVEVYGRTDVGRRRSENQDRLLVAPIGVGLADVRAAGDGDPATVGPVSFDVGSFGIAFLVADGMGGRAGGARASRLALEVIRDALVSVVDSTDAESSEAFGERLRQALHDANRKVFDEAETSVDHSGMGTTATLAGVLGDTVHVAQVGDSRAYLVRSGRVERLTRDQSLVQEMIDSGILDEQDAKSAGSHMLLQALGVRSDVRPALTSCGLRQGDLLLLCSDGLSQVVSDAEISEIAGRAEDCRMLGEALVAVANDRGGPDNVTIIAARLAGEALESSEVQDDSRALEP